MFIGERWLLVALPILQWVLTSLVRFVPVPIRNVFVKLLTVLIFGGGTSAIVIAEALLYRANGGASAFKGAGFLTLLAVQTIVSLLILTRIAAKRRAMQSSRK